MPFWLWLWMGLFGVLSLTCCHLPEKRRSATECFAWKSYFPSKKSPLIAPGEGRGMHVVGLQEKEVLWPFSSWECPATCLHPFTSREWKVLEWATTKVSQENIREIHLRILRAKRSASGNIIGCFNTYSFGDQSSFDMFLYSVGRLGLLI